MPLSVGGKLHLNNQFYINIFSGFGFPKLMGIGEYLFLLTKPLIFNFRKACLPTFLVAAYFS